MEAVELKISKYDWLYILVIGALFGFFISLVLYFLNYNLQYISTIFFSVFSAISISFFAFMLITVSNNLILPKLNQKFWYLISFFFSFCSGAFGFLLNYIIFLNLAGEKTPIIHFIQPYWFEITILIGFFTLLVGLILHQFISMKYKNELFRNEILETKIKALENELNPHFLFNALNSMSELVHINQDKAELSILNLSKFLRNAINNESLISIHSELNMVETYVDIENIRFDANINLSITDKRNIECKSSSAKIPKFSIQLLVENAIKHGFLNEILNIKIEIGNQYIEVSNDGKIPKVIVFGTGLSNLDKRLRLLNVGILESNLSVKDVKFIIKLGK